MKNTSKTLVFFGSGPVAATSLKHLLSSSFIIEYVVTKRRPLHHKDPALVEELAITKNLRILYADNSSELEEVILAANTKSKLGLVIDYGVIFNSKVIYKFAFGIINSHFSLLPEWRGADPITYALLSGQITTGISIMVINSHLDTGDIIAVQPCKIMPEDNNISLTKKLVNTSNSLLSELLPDMLQGKLIQASTQSDMPTTYSRKITKRDGLIDWNKPATVLEREIKAYYGWPGSYCKLADIDVIITKARAMLNIPITAGKTIISNQKTLHIGCRVGALEILEIKPIGKNVMPISAFINGYSSRLKI